MVRKIKIALVGAVGTGKIRWLTALTRLAHLQQPPGALQSGPNPARFRTGGGSVELQFWDSARPSVGQSLDGAHGVLVFCAKGSTEFDASNSADIQRVLNGVRRLAPRSTVVACSSDSINSSIPRGTPFCHITVESFLDPVACVLSRQLP